MKGLNSKVTDGHQLAFKSTVEQVCLFLCNEMYEYYQNVLYIHIGNYNVSVGVRTFNIYTWINEKLEN